MPSWLQRLTGWWRADSCSRSASVVDSCPLQRRPQLRVEELEGRVVPCGLAWGFKVSAAFQHEVRAIASHLHLNPNYLMAAMAFETGRSFDPATVNKQNHGVGLIQFTSPV